MAHTILSPTIITREFLRVLHQQSVFIGSINRQYDDRFANSGASPSGKIGPNLQIRMPNQFTVRTGNVMQLQDITEESQTLTVSTIKGVDFSFSSQDLTMTIDQFSARYIIPAATRLAAEIESDAISMYKDVYNFVDDDATALSALSYLKGGRKLDESLAPDSPRIALVCPEHSVKLVDALKGLFNPQVSLGSNLTEGEIARRTLGFDFKKSTLLTNHLTGTSVGGDTLWNVAAASQTGASLTVDTGTNTLKKGDIVTLAGSNAVHPETKADLGYLKTFTVTADFTASPLLISPPIVVTGAKQNVTASPTNGGAVSKLGSGTAASQTLVQSLLYHPDAFTFVSADLEDMSKYGAWGARQTMDGISMRIWRQGDITNNLVPTRIDVLYGYKTIRPELACRVHADG